MPEGVHLGVRETIGSRRGGRRAPAEYAAMELGDSIAAREDLQSRRV